jgi:hypothetical protein
MLLPYRVAPAAPAFRDPLVHARRALAALAALALVRVGWGVASTLWMALPFSGPSCVGSLHVPIGFATMLTVFEYGDRALTCAAAFVGAATFLVARQLPPAIPGRRATLASAVFSALSLLYLASGRASLTPANGRFTALLCLGAVLTHLVACRELDRAVRPAASPWIHASLGGFTAGAMAAGPWIPLELGRMGGNVALLIYAFAIALPLRRRLAFWQPPTRPAPSVDLPRLPGLSASLGPFGATLGAKTLLTAIALCMLLADRSGFDTSGSFVFIAGADLVLCPILLFALSRLPKPPQAAWFVGALWGVASLAIVAYCRSGRTLSQGPIAMSQLLATAGWVAAALVTQATLLPALARAGIPRRPEVQESVRKLLLAHAPLALLGPWWWGTNTGASPHLSGVPYVPVGLAVAMLLWLASRAVKGLHEIERDVREALEREASGLADERS